MSTPLLHENAPICYPKLLKSIINRVSQTRQLGDANLLQQSSQLPLGNLRYRRCYPRNARWWSTTHTFVKHGTDIVRRVPVVEGGSLLPDLRLVRFEVGINWKTPRIDLTKHAFLVQLEKSLLFLICPIVQRRWQTCIMDCSRQRTCAVPETRTATVETR